MRDYPERAAVPAAPRLPGGQHRRRRRRPASITDTQLLQLKDEVSVQTGTHALKFGVNYNYLQRHRPAERQRALRHPDVLRRPVGDHQQQDAAIPQGFQTPGIVQQWEQANPDLADSLLDAHQIATWFQDDWRVTPQADAQPGRALRHRRELLPPVGTTRTTRHGWCSRRSGTRTRGCRRRRTDSLSPRFGFAYDLSGDGRRVLRGGGGIYYDQFNINGGNVSDIFSQNKRPLNVLATLTNTAIGVGAARDLPLRGRSAAAAADRGPTPCRSAQRAVAGPGPQQPAHLPGAHRVRASARRQHQPVGRLHARRGTQRAAHDEHQPDRQRAARARAMTSSACSARPNYLSDVKISRRSTSRSTTR